MMWTATCTICGRERPLETCWHSMAYLMLDGDESVEHVWACNDGADCIPWILGTGIGRAWLEHRAHGGW